MQRPLHSSTPSRAGQQDRWKRRPLRLINVNFRSATGKKPDILNLLDSVRPDIVIGTETWLDSNIGDSEIFPDTYKLYRKDRNRLGGGVLIAVHTSIDSYEVEELQVNCELIWVKLKLQGRRYLYVCAYYRPDDGDEASLIQFNTSLERATLISNAHLLIGGDLNFPSWDWKLMALKPKPVHPRLHRDFISMLNDYNLEQLVEEPTRQENTLDLIITNNPQLIPRVEVLPGLSDHDTVYCEVAINTLKRKQAPRSIPLYKKADWESLKKSMSNLTNTLEEIKDTATTEMLWACFRDTLHAAIKHFIPHKQVRVKESQPWITPTLRRLIKRRDRVFKKMRKYGSEDLKQQHKQLRREVQRQLRCAYWSYLDDTFSEADSEQAAKNKRFWSYIKHLKSSNAGVAPLKEEGRLVSDPKAQADILNRQFQSVFGSGQTYSQEEFHEKCRLPPRDFPTLDKVNINIHGVKKLISNLKPGKAPGPDNISPRILKELANELAPALTIIFQSSVNTGTLPADWKTAHVTPVFKKGEQYNPANYRPVSLTSVCCKMLEHILTSTIMNHLEHHGILCNQQHGFRMRRSCETQLLDFTNELFENMESGKQTDILVLDFAKAFDKVNHSLLTHKLNYYGIGGEINTWIADFLRDRKQAVVVSGERSDFIPVRSGVPQGSVLGPCLFLIYINDLPDILTTRSRLFADDTAVYNIVTSPAAQAHLQQDLNQLAAWEKRWDMSFHPGKCTTLPVTRCRNPLHFDYCLHGHILETVTSAKYLGVTICSDLSWDTHINHLCNKANKTLGFLRRNIKISSRKIKETAYKTFVRPILEYASSIWDPHTEQNTNKLEAVQRRAARFVMRRYHNTSSPTTMLEELKWPSLQDRRRTARLSMLYKIRNDLVSTQGIKASLSPAPPRRRRGHDQQLTIPQCRTQYRQQAFLPRTIRDWNELPQDAVEAKTIDTFVSRASRLH